MGKKLDYKEVKAYIEGEEGNGCKLLSKEYLGYNRLLKIKCKCGKKFEVTFKKFKEENYKTCFNCGTDYRDTTKYRDFVKNVRLKYNNICQCCKKGGNVVHHLNGYDWDLLNRSNIDNGVVLCDECHKKFHTIFGYGCNTKRQYIYFRTYRLFERNIIDDSIKDYFKIKMEKEHEEIKKKMNRIVCIYKNGDIIIKDNKIEMARYLKVDEYIVNNLVLTGKPYNVTNRTTYNTTNKLKIKGARILKYDQYLNEIEFNKIN